MDYYSILDSDASQAGLEPAPPDLAAANLGAAHLASADADANAESDTSDLIPFGSEKAEAASVVAARDALRFPGEDGGRSLSEMAQRDLDATLQLLAERAQYITGASGAAVALRDGESMVCCASSGPSAPELGAHLQIDSGLSAESVRTRKILRCDDAENDPRVNRDSCRAFGIASVVVMPLVRGEEVYGVFELLSSRPRAFEERDFVALNRLAEMIQTAVEHSEAARRAEKELGHTEKIPAVVAEVAPDAIAPGLGSNPVASGSETRGPVIKPAMVEEAKPAAPAPIPAPISPADLTPDTSLLASTDAVSIPELPAGDDIVGADLDASISTIAFGNLRKCEACGFPVSQGRRLCLDCEAATPGAIASVDTAPEFFSELVEPETSWVRSHVYLIATGLIAAATIALLLWRF